VNSLVQIQRLAEVAEVCAAYEVMLERFTAAMEKAYQGRA
jgi:hypothetical protein